MGALRRAARSLGAAGGTGPADDPLLRAERREGQSQGRRETRTEAVLQVFTSRGLPASATLRRRMAEHGRGQAIPVEVRRRFGRTVRGPDGSVVHIEQVVRIRSRPPEASPAEGPDDYGKGFERRVEETEDTVTAPVVKVGKTVKGD